MLALRSRETTLDHLFFRIRSYTNASRTGPQSWRTISASARIARSSRVCTSVQLRLAHHHYDTPLIRQLFGFCSHSARSGTDSGNVTRSPTRDQSRNQSRVVFAFTQKAFWQFPGNFPGPTRCVKGASVLLLITIISLTIIVQP